MNFTEQAQEMMANLTYTIEKLAIADMWRGANSAFCGDQIDSEMNRSYDWTDVSFWALAN